MNFENELYLAETGDIQAMVDVAESILWDDPTVPMNPEMQEKAMNFLRKAIDAGSADAMLCYGSVFYNGRGVEQDFNEAAHWYNEAAKRGNAIAVNNMGYVCYYGRGDQPVDMEKAYQYFSKAALLGIPNAMYKCGDMFFYGKYVDKDLTTAFNLYWKCYHEIEDKQPIDCYPDVCRRLGTCYHLGLGTERNLQMAEFYLSEATTFFRIRMEDGDIFTENILKEAEAELIEVTHELDVTNPELTKQVPYLWDASPSQLRDVRD